MLTKRMSAREARANFSDLLGLVYYGKESVIVEKKGRPVAVVISPDEFARLMKEQEQAFELIDAIRERNADKTPEQVTDDVTAVVKAVRKERYERQRASKSRR